MEDMDTHRRMLLNSIGHDIIGASFEVRRTAGRFLRERYYKYALAYELKNLGHYIEIEKSLPALYKGIEIQDSLHMDLVVDGCIIIETKAQYLVGNAEFRQLMTYLKLSNFNLGYLINFGVEDFLIADKEHKFNPHYGIYRFINNI